MKLSFEGEYTSKDIKFITSVVQDIEFPEENEYLYVGEITFVATKNGDEITINKIKNVL